MNFFTGTALHEEKMDSLVTAAAMAEVGQGVATAEEASGIVSRLKTRFAGFNISADTIVGRVMDALKFGGAAVSSAAMLAGSPAAAADHAPVSSHSHAAALQMAAGVKQPVTDVLAQRQIAQAPLSPAIMAAMLLTPQLDPAIQAKLSNPYNPALQISYMESLEGGAEFFANKTNKEKLMYGGSGGALGSVLSAQHNTCRTSFEDQISPELREELAQGRERLKAAMCTPEEAPIVEADNTVFDIADLSPVAGFQPAKSSPLPGLGGEPYKPTIGTPGRLFSEQFETVANHSIKPIIGETRAKLGLENADFGVLSPRL